MTLSFPDHQEQAVLLACVPHKGERVRLRNGGGQSALLVHDVLYLEGGERGQEPDVIVFVKRVEDS